MSDPRDDPYLRALAAIKADPRYNPMLVGCDNCDHDIELHFDDPGDLGCFVCDCMDPAAEEDLAWCAEQRRNGVQL